MWAGLLQSLDVSINKPLKDCLRKLYTDWLTEEDHQLTAIAGSHQTSITVTGGSLGSGSVGLHPRNSLIVRAFKNCSISNALDGTEDSNKEVSDEASNNEE